MLCVSSIILDFAFRLNWLKHKLQTSPNIKISIFSQNSTAWPRYCIVADMFHLFMGCQIGVKIQNTSILKTKTLYPLIIPVYESYLFKSQNYFEVPLPGCWDLKVGMLVPQFEILFKTVTFYYHLICFHISNSRWFLSKQIQLF